MSGDAREIVSQIYTAARVVLVVRGVGGRPWLRKVKGGPRVGPWLQADYEIVDQNEWKRSGPCLYLVGVSDGGVRYVGISRNRLKDRWRTSPPCDAETKERLPRNQLFHSQCWKHLEDEMRSSPGSWYEVRVIAANELSQVLASVGSPLPELTAEPDIVAAVETFIRRNRSDDLARWNAQ